MLLENENINLAEVKNVIIEHLQEVNLKLGSYFLEDKAKYTWVRNSFNIGIEDLSQFFSDVIGLQKKLIKVESDEILLQFSEIESQSSFIIK